MHLLAKQTALSARKDFIVQMCHWQALCHVLMELTQTKKAKWNASSAQQEISVPLLHKESSHVKMGHTVKVDHLSVLNVQVDTAAQNLMLIQYNVQLEHIHRLEAKPACSAHRVPNV